MDEHAVVAAVLVDAGHVLLCHRSSTRNWYPNVWDVPGGHIEAHELPEEALRRELIEELGIDVGQVTEPPAFKLNDPDTAIELTVWVFTTWEGTVGNVQPDEHDDLRWFRVDELRDLTLADDRYLDLFARILASS